MGLSINDISADRYKHWHFKNTSLLLLSILLIIAFIDSPVTQRIVITLNAWGYVGAFIAGVFFVLSFTAVPAGIILYSFAQTHDPLMTALAGGLGGMVGDYLIFRVFRDYIFDELGILFKNSRWRRIKKLFRTPYFAWLLPLIGAGLIMAPGPDEPGIALMGLSKIKTWQFVLVAFVLDTVGILLIVLALRSLL